MLIYLPSWKPTFMAKKKTTLRPFLIFASVSLEELGQKEGALGPTLNCMYYVQVSSATLNTLKTTATI